MEKKDGKLMNLNFFSVHNWREINLFYSTKWRIIQKLKKKQQVNFKWNMFAYQRLENQFPSTNNLAKMEPLHL